MSTFDDLMSRAEDLLNRTGEEMRTVTLSGGPHDGVSIEVPGWFNHLKIHQLIEDYQYSEDLEAMRFSLIGRVRVGWYRSEIPGEHTLYWKGWEKNKNEKGVAP